jgi:seryl-tRNA synthetase
MRAMLDLNFVADNLDLVAGKVRARGAELDFEALTRLNEERKRLQTEISTLRHDHQLESKRTAGLMKEGRRARAEELRAKLRQESDAIQEREERLGKSRRIARALSS